MPDLPTYCAWCGAYLQGGATQHAPDCWVPLLPTAWLNTEPLGVSPIAALRRAMAADCACRTCGHRAGSHICGSCFECGREGCWS